MIQFLTSTGMNPIVMIVMLAATLGIFYFMMIRPENKRKKEAEQMAAHEALKLMGIE